jgi:hypothetical protein
MNCAKAEEREREERVAQLNKKESNRVVRRTLDNSDLPHLQVQLSVSIYVTHVWNHTNRILYTLKFILYTLYMFPSGTAGPSPWHRKPIPLRLQAQHSLATGIAWTARINRTARSVYPDVPRSYGETAPGKLSSPYTYSYPCSPYPCYPYPCSPYPCSSDAPPLHSFTLLTHTHTYTHHTHTSHTHTTHTHTHTHTE